MFIDDKPAPARPATWKLWSPAEQRAWLAEERAVDELEAVLTKALDGKPFDPAQNLHGEAEEAAMSIREAALDQHRALLKRWLPHLSDLIDLAFDRGDREAQYVPQVES